MARAKRIPPSGGAKIGFYVDTHHVEQLLLRLDTALSPISLAVWLTDEPVMWFKGRAERRFGLEGDDASGKWAPLKAATQSFRQAAGYGPAHPINVRTHQLESYITGTQGLPHGTPTGFGAILNYPGGSMSKNLKDKVETAQIGRNDNPRTVPRPVLAVNEVDLGQLLTSLSVFIGESGAGIV
jgi:hypothetical protein